MLFLGRAAFFAAAAFLLPAFVAADEAPIAPASPAEPKVPAQITRSVMMIQLNDRIHDAVCLDFLNTSQTLITGVRFDFFALDAFHDVVAHFHGDRLGKFSPGVKIEGPKDVDEFFQVFSGGLGGGTVKKLANCFTYYSLGVPATIRARISHVLFADGSEWLEPLPGALQPTASEMPSSLGTPADVPAAHAPSAAPQPTPS